MKPVETYTDVTINERKFRIMKFDARTGSFMLIKVTKMLAPLVKNINFSKIKDVKDASEVDLGAFDLSAIMAELGSISESDFNYIQDKCLNVCYEHLQIGLTKILNENGTFGVIDLEDNAMMALALTAHALIFNVKGFFQGSPLQSLVGGILTTSPRG